MGQRVPGFLRPGSWIGGDRDGNPFVTAESLKVALSKASGAAIGFYLDQLHALGSELSISAEHAPVDEAVMALAEASGDDAQSRHDEPYRRALSGIYARLAATYRKLVGTQPPRPAAREAKPYADPGALRADLLALARGLSAAGGGLLASGGAIGRLIRAVEVFGFHLATLDLRQNSAVHELSLIHI